MSEYRDARTGLLQHIADADAAIEERSARMTEALRQLLPKMLAARIDELRAVATPENASVADLAQIAEQRVALVEALDEALGHAPKLEARLTNTPDGTPEAPPQEDLWGPIGTEEAMVPHRAKVEPFVYQHDPNGSVLVRGKRITVRMSVDDVPLLWIVEFGAAVNVSSLTPAISFLSAAHVVEAHVSKALPRLHVRRHSIGDSIREFFTRTHDVTQGDPAFDEAFHVEGDEAFARPLLTETVRRQLFARAEQGKFALDLANGLLTLNWSARSYVSLVSLETFALSAKLVAQLRNEATSFALVTEREA